MSSFLRPRDLISPKGPLSERRMTHYSHCFALFVVWFQITNLEVQGSDKFSREEVKEFHRDSVNQTVVGLLAGGRRVRRKLLK